MIGPTLLISLLIVAGVAISLGIAWGCIRVLVHIVVRAGILPKQGERSGRWSVLNYVDYPPAGALTTSLFPLGTSAAVLTGRWRPLETDPRTGERVFPQQGSQPAQPGASPPSHSPD